MRPSLSKPLASYRDREEFQIERIIVWVLVSPDNRAASIGQANAIVGQVWNAIPEVLRVAQDASRLRLPLMWQAYDAADIADRQLAVYGIWIDPSTGSAVYHVAWNYDNTNPEGVPELPDDHRIAVTRHATGAVTADPVA